MSGLPAILPLACSFGRIFSKANASVPVLIYEVIILIFRVSVMDSSVQPAVGRFRFEIVPRNGIDYTTTTMTGG